MCDRVPTVQFPVPFAQRLVHAMDVRLLCVPHLRADLLERGVDVSERTIFRWRAGDAVPGVEALPAIASCLATSADWLLGAGADDQVPTTTTWSHRGADDQ